MCHDVFAMLQPNQYELILYLAEPMCMIHFSHITFTVHDKLHCANDTQCAS